MKLMRNLTQGNLLVLHLQGHFQRHKKGECLETIQTLVSEVFDSSDDDYREPKSVFSEGNQNESIAEVTVHRDAMANPSASAAIGAENDANAISTQTPVIAAAASALGAQKVNDKATVVKNQNVKETSGKKVFFPHQAKEKICKFDRRAL